MAFSLGLVRSWLDHLPPKIACVSHSIGSIASSVRKLNSFSSSTLLLLFFNLFFLLLFKSEKAKHNKKKLIDFIGAISLL